MLKPDFKVRAAGGEDYPVMPEDTYQAVVEDINLEEQPNFKTGEPEEILKFKFLVLEEGEYKGLRVFKSVRPVLSAGFEQGSPSSLYELYKSAMKKLPNEEQLKNGLTAEEVNGLIGKQLRLVVKVKTSKKGRQYNNVDGMLPAKTELPMPKLKTKEPGEIKKMDREPAGEEEEEATDIFADMDEVEKVNAELAGRSRQEIEDGDIPVIN